MGSLDPTALEEKSLRFSVFGIDEDERNVSTGVVELKRNANGTFEARFVDKVRVLAMLRELMDDRQDCELEDFLNGLYQPGEGDGA